MARRVVRVVDTSLVHKAQPELHRTLAVKSIKTPYNLWRGRTNGTYRESAFINMNKGYYKRHVMYWYVHTHCFYSNTSVRTFFFSSYKSILY